MFLVLCEPASVHSGGVKRGRHVAVAMAVGVRDRWQETGDRWQVTGGRWHVTGDRWHMLHDYYCFVFFTFVLFLSVSVHLSTGGTIHTHWKTQCLNRCARFFIGFPIQFSLKPAHLADLVSKWQCPSVQVSVCHFFLIFFLNVLLLLCKMVESPIQWSEKYSQGKS